MRDLIKIVEQSSTGSVGAPSLYFRGSSMGASSSHLSKLWRQPSPDLPPVINDVLTSGLTSRVYGLSYNTPFKISRTYNGMSNWGFGVYFATDMDWARRYGNCITVVQIDPGDILTIRDTDFANRVSGTSGGELHRRLIREVGDMAPMSEQARVMGKVVRSMKKGARALFVQTDDDGRGQICVFGVQAIYPRFYFEVQNASE